MVKLARDPHIVWKDRYYIWTYKPIKRENKRYTQRSLYPKFITPIPYLSRLHIKHVIVYSFGPKILTQIHIISGKRLIKQGITYLKWGKYQYNCFYLKDRMVHVKKWAYPPEDKRDAHRRRKYIIRLCRAAERMNRVEFNRYYKLQNYGYNYSGFSRYYLRNQYNKVRDAIAQEIFTPKQRRKIRLR